MIIETLRKYVNDQNRTKCICCGQSVPDDWESRGNYKMSFIGCVKLPACQECMDSGVSAACFPGGMTLCCKKHTIEYKIKENPAWLSRPDVNEYFHWIYLDKLTVINQYSQGMVHYITEGTLRYEEEQNSEKAGT